MGAVIRVIPEQPPASSGREEESDMTKSVIVVGGGIAGLTAALYAAREGARVALFERVSEPGGRARTRDEQGFRFNMGPHALYKSAEGMQILGELGIEIAGRAPQLGGAGARLGGRVHALPGGFVSLLTTGLLRPSEKIETGRFLAALPGLDASSFAGQTLDEVLARELRSPRVRQLVAAIVRLSTYTHAPDRIGADAAIEQVQRALHSGVLYPDQGWSQLVEALRTQALARGVEIRTGAGVRSVTPAPDGFSVTFQQADAPSVAAKSVVLAVSPSECARLLPATGEPGRRAAAWEKALQPVRASSLEIALSKLPEPRHTFCLGIDEATYFSVHSATARLAPGDGAVIHCLRYLGPDECPPRDVVRKELEAVVDDMQPGWRDHAVDVRLLGDLTVTHALVPRGGFEARPPVSCAGRPGLHVAGDWVGSEGMLADASFASGRRAGCSAARSAGAGA
jgi:phytoene dehydrogenase-like protein